MGQIFLANQSGRSLMVDRQKSSQEVTKTHAEELDDSNMPTNRQKKEAIKQYSEQQKLFT
tara:strand:+ start:1758 stop:1937 length:180 start_codon:yes stop_codon:yes gene_type:complete